METYELILRAVGLVSVILAISLILLGFSYTLNKSASYHFLCAVSALIVVLAHVLIIMAGFGGALTGVLVITWLILTVIKFFQASTLVG